MNWGHLFIGAVVAGWVLSVEYRLWANLNIWAEQQKRVTKQRDHLHAVEK